jgi:hypothetical protein
MNVNEIKSETVNRKTQVPVMEVLEEGITRTLTIETERIVFVLR